MRKPLLQVLKISMLIICMFVTSMVCSMHAHASTDTVVEEQTNSEEQTNTEIKKLKKTKITSIAATDKGTVELKWKKVDGANRYVVYRKKQGQKIFQKLIRTSKASYIDKSGKSNVTYIYQIQTVLLDDEKQVVGKGDFSASKKCKVRKKNPKIAYVGDSIMTGFSGYGVLKGRKNCKVFAKVGVNPKSFLSSKEMTSLLKYNPDRMYIMLGVNSLWTTESWWMNSLWDNYEKILNKCRKKNPNMEIVVVGVAPVGRSADVTKKAVNTFNKLLKKKVAKKAGMYYCDISDGMTDSKGYLRSKYACGDGVHWQVKTYKYVLKKWDKFSEKIYW